VYFKNIRIGDRLNAFREWRESLDRVVDYRQETLAKEIAFRKMKAMNKLKLGMFDPRPAAIAAPSFTTSAVPLQAT